MSALIKFTDVCFITDDVLRLRKFYEEIFNVTAEGDEIHSGIAVGGFGFSFDSAELLQNDNSFGYVSGESSNNTIVGFNVDDVDAEYQRLKVLDMGDIMLNEPTTHPWGARSFQFKDPDGNILNFRTIK